MPRSPSPERSLPARRRAGLGGSNLVSRGRSPSPPRRSLRPRRAAAPSSRPLVDDFFPFCSSPSPSPPRPQLRRPSPEPSNSDSDGGGGGAGSTASDRRRRKLKLVVKLSQLPPEQNQRRVPPPPPFSDSSDGEVELGDVGRGGEEQVKPPKKRRIEPRGDRSRPHEVGGRSDASSAPRTKRLPVPGMARTTPLPDRKSLDMILDKLQKKDTYGVFAEPVDLDDLPDYHDVIEHPMDFGTVRKKLARNAYRSFEQFEDDVFLICNNAMLYNAPDTIYFRQAHSIQELARKKFQELRDEGIHTENQIKSEQKVRPNSFNKDGEPVKKPVLRYSEDDLDFLTRKEQFKRPTSNVPRAEQVKRPNPKIPENDLGFVRREEQVKRPIPKSSECDLDFLSRKEQVKKLNSKNSDDGIIFKTQVKKPISRNSEGDLSSSLHKERVKKPILRNSEDDTSSSFHREQAKRSISRNSEDGRGSSFHKEQVRKTISGCSENDRSTTFHKQPVKKPTSRSSKDDLIPQKKHIKKPICTNGEDSDCPSQKETVEKPVYTKRENMGLSPKKFVENPTCRYGDDLGRSRQEVSAKQPIGRGGLEDLGYSCNVETVKKPVCVKSQDAMGSNVSAATSASAGDCSNGLSISQANATEPPPGCSVNEFSDKDISSTVDEIIVEKADDISGKDYSAKPSNKSIVVDETRRNTYGAYEEQPLSDSDSIFDVFSAEPKELITVGLHAEHSYARSLARFAGSLDAQGWRIASGRIQQALPAEVKFGRGWVGEYEPPLPPILVAQDQLSSISSEANIQRNSYMLRDNERLRPTESSNQKDMSLSLLNRITTVNNGVGVSGSLESPEVKPRLFGVTAEPQHRNSDASSLHENRRVSGSVAKTKRTANEQMRKGRPSSSARPPEIQPQRSECSKEASSSVHHMPAVNKMAGQPRPFFQLPEAARTHQMKKCDSSKSTRPIEMAPQRLECPKGLSSGVQNMLSPNNTNGQPKPFFQSQDAAVPLPKSEATWVYHGRPGDGKFGTSDKSRPMSNIGFITKNQPLTASSFTRNGTGQKNANDQTKLMGSTAVPDQVNVPNRGFDVSRNMFSAFPAAARENQSIPTAPVAQSWISFGTSSESKPTIVSPTFHDSSSGWKMPFANVRASDEPKINVIPQFFRQPVQVRENPVHNKGLVIFPQLVQSDFSRSQGQPQWQGLIPHMQQKPNKDLLRPDLNIGFPSPGSPPARQSSGINLEPQQPDLALQL